MGTPWKEMTSEQRVLARARQKRYWDKNRERLAAKKNRHYHKFRDKYLEIERARSYKRLYGITVGDYDAMLSRQGGCCAICKSQKAGPKTSHFAVDHCHDTGAVRGLLCVKCNARLGWLQWYRDHDAAIQAYLSQRYVRGAA